MKLIQNDKGKEVNYKFSTKEAFKEYISTCEIIWGSIPCDVNWAMGTNIYKETIKTNKHESDKK